MIKSQLTAALSTALASLGVEIDQSVIEIERPARKEHGDWSSNVALASAKIAKTNPRQLATDVVAKLNEAEIKHVEAIEIAGPGFINFRLKPTWLHTVLRNVVEATEAGFGKSTQGNGTHINVESVSANPNKPLHAGHGRGAVYGDTIARLLEASGYQVTRETYLNDRGVQMTRFAESLIARKAGKEVPEDGYHGDYVIEWAKEMPEGVDALEWGYKRALQSHRETLKALNVHHDIEFSERSLVAEGAVQTTLADLTDKGVVFQQDGATWLKSTDYGDDKDRVLVKSDGDYTYLLPDVAYHRNKFARSNKLINVWGADHHGYVTRMKAAVAALGNNPDDLEIIITQLVDFERDGEAVRMSGRSGEMITLDELIAEIGGDAARFSYLSQSMDTRQTMDLAVLSQASMDNPVYYVQYAHARINSLVKKAGEEGLVLNSADIAELDLSPLTHERELAVLRMLEQYENTLKIATREYAPHRIIQWLRDLAGAFHGFYHDCKVTGQEIPEATSKARLALIEACRVGLVAGLDLVGVSAPESM